MIINTLAYLGLTLMFSWAAPALAVRAHPAWSVRLIVPAAVGLTGAGLFVLAANTLTWAAQRPEVAELGDWSAGELRLHDPVPHVIAGISAALLAASLLSMSVVGYRRVRALAHIRRAVRSCDAPGDVILLADSRADAFTTPGRHGRIVVTTALMNALTPSQRTALVAHERSHQRHCHAWWILAMEFAAAANPLFRRGAGAVTHAVERWADEDAAVDVDDRRLVAHAVARASLLRKRGTEIAATLTLAVTGGNIPARVGALLDERPRRSSFAAAVLVLMVIAVGIAALGLERSADAVFDAAHVR